MSLARDDRTGSAGADLDAARERRAAELFKSAIALGESRRGSYLSTACGNDARLRARVERLLRFDAQTGAGLDPPPLQGLDAPSLIGSAVGRYRVVRQIAVGGMGVVYEAMQENPRRKVALKLLRNGIGSENSRRRFEYEAQVLARLQHPSIAQIHEAGEHVLASGAALPYFAMEYVPDARSITAFAAERRLTTERRLELFARVCEAVQHGHQKGVIHRDLKPSNILVDAGGLPKVIDFGVARCTDSDVAVATMQTAAGELIGTLQYMSPEQCEAGVHDLDTRTDVYSLGVVLYELVCRCLPYDLAGVPLHEATRRVREQLPARPSTVDRMLRGDLETIVLKALEKDREQRYASAAALAQDIESYLDRRPIVARPPSVLYQLRTFARRNRVLVGSAAALFVTLVAGLVGTTWQAARATQAEATYRGEAERAHTLLTYLSGMSGASGLHGKHVTVLQMLGDAARQTDLLFADQPLYEVDLRFALGNCFVALGEFEQGEKFLRRARELRGRLLGPEHPETIECDCKLAGALLRLGRVDEAEQLALPAVATLSRAGLSPNDVRWIEALDAASAVHETRNRLDDVEHLCRKILINAPSIYQGRFDVEFMLMRALIAQGRHVEAEAIANERLRSGTIEANGLEIVDWQAAIVLARCARARGDWQGAYQLLDETRRAILCTHGVEHSGANDVLREMGWQRTLEGRFADAEALYRALLAQAPNQSAGDFATCADMQQLAWSLSQRALLDGLDESERRSARIEAESLHRDALVILRRRPGPDPEHLFKELNQFAWFLLGCGRPAEAETVAREAVDGYRHLAARADGNKVATIDTLAVLLRDRGQDAEAETLFREALEQAALAPPSGRDLVPEIELHLGELLLARRRFDEAQDMLSSSYRTLTAIAPIGSAIRHAALTRLVELCELRGDTSGALAFRQQMEVQR